jgi:hypothetical protein
VPIFKKINKDFFKKWTLDMAYVLGFFAADGNMIETKRGTRFLSFHSADMDLIEKVRTAMDSEHLVSKRISKGKVWYRLQIGSKEMFEDIEKLGLFPNKSKRMRMPRIPTKLLGDFIRGYFDGDGNVWTGLTHKETLHPLRVIRTAFTSASKNFLEDLHMHLFSLGVAGGSLGKVKDKDCYRLKLATADSLKLYEIMYNGPDTSELFLKRKKDVFEKYMHAAVAQR